VAVANDLVSKGRRVRGRSLLLRLVDPGFRRLSRGRHPADHSGFDQSEVHRGSGCRELGHRVPHVRRDDQQGSFAGPWIAEHFKGKNVAIVDDKSAYARVSPT